MDLSPLTVRKYINSLPIKYKEQTIERWHGICPCCGAKRSIIKKLGEQQAYCEKCGPSFTVEHLEEYTAKTQDKGDSAYGRNTLLG